MKIVDITQPIVFLDPLTGEEKAWFSVHIQCSCGHIGSRFVCMPLGRRPVLVCICCQERHIIEFPIH